MGCSTFRWFRYRSEDVNEVFIQSGGCLHTIVSPPLVNYTNCIPTSSLHRIHRIHLSGHRGTQFTTAAHKNIQLVLVIEKCSPM